MDPVALFGVLLKDSALALGGLGSLPLLRQDLVATGVVTDTQLVEALAIGRLSTGPNGLWIVSLGYQLAGPLGAAMALLASSLPPLAILPATAVARRWLLSVPFAGLVAGSPRHCGRGTHVSRPFASRCGGHRWCCAWPPTSSVGP